MVDDEPIARYVLDKKKLKFQKGEVHYAVFLPWPDDTSVFRIAGLSDSDIWSLGCAQLAGPQNRRLKGRADLRVDLVRSIGLEVESQPDSHPRHAGVVLWPQEKDEQMELALQLAELAELHKAPAS